MKGISADHDKNLSSLINSVANGRLSHAYLFSGPSGSGKKETAMAFAEYLICSGQSAQSGKLFECGANPDYKYVEPEGKSIKIEEIRKIIADTSMRPTYCDRKVYFINDADKMTHQAQNSLLKILEEPPSYVVFILATTNKNALLETVRSRLTIYEFHRNEDARFRKIFENNGELREETLRISQKMKDHRMLDAFELYSFFENNKQSIETILDLMQMYFRDLLVSSNAQDEALLINSDKKGIILENARVWNSQKLIENIEIIERTRRKIKQNVNYQLSIEVMLMDLQEVI